uniref:Uncharacterized protein n=1 Tax=Planktothricoides sp. SpSt-374 TaxID=2282167 RepID=A0A7C3VHW2_9CYAN
MPHYLAKAHLVRHSIKRKILIGIILLSEAVFEEIQEVLFRSKLDCYVSRDIRANFLDMSNNLLDKRNFWRRGDRETGRKIASHSSSLPPSHPIEENG